MKKHTIQSMNEALNPECGNELNESMAPKNWEADRSHSSISKYEDYKGRRLSSNFDIFKTDKGKFVLVNVSDRKKPIITANTVGQLVKLARKDGYKFTKAKKSDWDGYEEPGRSKQRFTPYD
jgi:hypothetical protein